MELETNREAEPSAIPGSQSTAPPAGSAPNSEGPGERTSASTARLAPAIRDFADLSVALIAGLTLSLAALLISTQLIAENIANRDFIQFWAGAKQLVHRANPYDKEAVSHIEHAAGFTPAGAQVMRNPPWALPLVFPLGFFGVRVAATLWTLVLFACLAISVHHIRALHRSPPGLAPWLGLCFPPALLSLTMGQTSLFALLGLVLFLRYHSVRPFAAGFALWLCALKPHLFLPFGVVLVAWTLIKRNYRIAAGALVSLALSNAAALILYPAAWPAYLRMMSSSAIQQEMKPCLSDFLLFWLNPAAIWIQYVPAALGCIWALGYFWRRRHAWDWISNSGPLMLVSLLLAPYCWFYDQALAIPAIMQGCYVTRRRWLLVLLVLLVALVDIEMCRVPETSFLYLWNMPVWIAWYLLACASALNQNTRPEALPA